ncbi:MAG TPA: hypothetical protein VHB73_00090 [Alphaproteobacteria bacterium]|nr:hypothetical protein [Alphaproteobacteria bacterium]
MNRDLLLDEGQLQLINEVALLYRRAKAEFGGVAELFHERLETLGITQAEGKERTSAPTFSRIVLGHSQNGLQLSVLCVKQATAAQTPVTNAGPVILRCLEGEGEVFRLDQFVKDSMKDNPRAAGWSPYRPGLAIPVNLGVAYGLYRKTPTAAFLEIGPHSTGNDNPWTEAGTATAAMWKQGLRSRAPTLFPR